MNESGNWELLKLQKEFQFWNVKFGIYHKECSWVTLRLKKCVKCDIVIPNHLVIQRDILNAE